MADNVIINAPSVPGGPTIRTLDTGSGVELPIGGISDATGTTVAAVKPASTAAQGTDPALVVAISPNNTVPVTGTVTSTPVTSSTGTVTSVAASVTSVTLLAANPSRKGFTITNDSTSVLYVALASSASSTAYTIELNPGDYYECPFNYEGIVSGVWASAVGDARMTEVA